MIDKKIEKWKVKRISTSVMLLLIFIIVIMPFSDKQKNEPIICNEKCKFLFSWMQKDL